jgi:hypothetical protein
LINGITFSEQLIRSKDFAHFMYTFLNGTSGITKGCEISHADGNVYVQKGYFIQHGRFVEVVGTETIPSPEVLSGQLYCTVVFEIDLSKVNSVSEFKQGTFKTLTSTTNYPSLTQQDLDKEGVIYQIPWCQYVKKIGGIEQFRDIRRILNLSSVWSAVSSQNGTYKADFDNYFNSQKSTIQNMINELKDRGYLLIARQKEVKPIYLDITKWSAAAPYTQEIDVPGITATDTPTVGLYILGNESPEVVRMLKKQFSRVDFVETLNGKIRVKCLDKKPEITFSIGLKGV